MSYPFAFPTRRVLVAMLAFSGLAAHAATLRVPSQYPTIQGAIDASHSGDTVLVAPGKYPEGLRIYDKGILTLESEAGAESTILDGEGNSYVIELSAPRNSHKTEYRIAGFTIRHGIEQGIRGSRGRTHIENNIVTANRRFTLPACAAIRLQDSGGTIRNNRIESNGATGICLFNPHQVLVEGNRVEGNAAFGISVTGLNGQEASAKVVRNVVKGNGGQDFYVYGFVHLQVADNLFVRRSAHDRQTAYFVGGDSEGGAITGKFFNNTIVATASRVPVVSFDGDVAGLTVANNIVWSGSEAPALTCGTPKTLGGIPEMHHNDAFSASGLSVDGFCIEEFARGPGNLSVDPLFAAGQDGANWKLSTDSPLVDQGDNSVVGNLRRDIRGAPRIVDGGHGLVVDMGAYENLPK